MGGTGGGGGNSSGVNFYADGTFITKGDTSYGVLLQSIGGGGGAGGTGQNGNIRFTDSGGNGGAGLASSISGSSQFYAAGGGGGATHTVNVNPAGADGASGIVIIRYQL